MISVFDIVDDWCRQVMNPQPTTQYVYIDLL